MKSGWAFVLILFILGCSNEKNSSEKGGMDVQDFFGFFKTVKLPYIIADTSFNRLSRDTPIIQTEIFTQFVGDTLLSKNFGKATPKIYPVGRVSVKKAETYLFAKAISGSKKVAYLLVFDKENVFKAALPLIVLDSDRETSQSALMDNKYTIALSRQRKKPNGDLGYKREAYIYNNIGVFTLILTESNDDLATTADVINPIDTLSRKNKYSGDYFVDKRNFVSVRDGRKFSELRFFVHFEKSKGTCKGELRGEATLTKPNVAVYQESGDPCVLQFTFSANALSMKEVQGCGNYRDIKCFFEGVYPRKKERSKPAKKN